MKLTELQPRWVTPDVFILKSPTGHGDWLSCKRVAMPTHEQMRLLYRVCPDLKGQSIVTTKPEMVWEFDAGGDFDTLTVKPSIDHSPSGNWHGFITNGQVT